MSARRTYKNERNMHKFVMREYDTCSRPHKNQS